MKAVKTVKACCRKEGCPTATLFDGTVMISDDFGGQVLLSEEEFSSLYKKLYSPTTDLPDNPAR